MLKSLLVGTLLKTVLNKAKDEVLEKFVEDKVPAGILNPDSLKDDFVDYLSNLARDEFEELVDGFLDKLEDDAKESANKWDDIFVLPLCKIVREILHVPDNDEEDE